MFYDLHIHSCLSPCADDDMTPNNIVNMSMIKGLDVIAICDHNSTLQLAAFTKLNTNINIIYGIEVETVEEVHVLGLFRSLTDAQKFGKWLDANKLKTDNDPSFFGHQLVMDENDQVINEHKDLLITSTFIDIDTCIDMIHAYHGSAVLAHVLDRKNSIINQLGFIPPDIKANAFEVKNIEQISYLKKTYPYLSNKTFIINSDAHRLIDINERENAFDDKTFQKLWSK